MAEGAAIPRTRTALADHLTELRVSENSYHLYGAHLDDAIVMDHRSEGWVVFYSERGGESALNVRRTEADACADLLRLEKINVFFTLVAGPSPASEADAAFDSWLAGRGASRSSLLAEDWKSDDMPMGRRAVVAPILRPDNRYPPARSSRVERPTHIPGIAAPGAVDLAE